MNYFVDSDDRIFAYENDVKTIPKGLTPITEDKALTRVLEMNDGKPYRDADA